MRIPAVDAKSKAVKAHRTRLRRRGLKRLEVCVPAREAAVIRRAAQILRERASEAAHLRRVLGFTPEPDRPSNGAELFAMPQPLRPAVENLWDEAMARIERDRKARAVNRARKVAL